MKLRLFLAMLLGAAIALAAVNFQPLADALKSKARLTAERERVRNRAYMWHALAAKNPSAEATRNAIAAHERFVQIDATIASRYPDPSRPWEQDPIVAPPLTSR